jgi:hypothetical protein
VPRRIAQERVPTASIASFRLFCGQSFFSLFLGVPPLFRGP